MDNIRKRKVGNERNKGCGKKIDAADSQSQTIGKKKANLDKAVVGKKKSAGGKKRFNQQRNKADHHDMRRGKPDPFPSDMQVPEEKMQEYDTGAEKLQPDKAQTRVQQRRLGKKKTRFIERIERTARAEILNTEEAGYIEPDEGIPTFMTSQAEICDAVDVLSATKHFELNLNRFGPYRINYTLNGRHLVIGGRKGHVAAFDWMTKDLLTEFNAMETVRDVQWLHIETMFAVAQKRWLRIYDRSGTELHCIKSMFDIKRMEFLPRHFLLVAGSGSTFLTWLDVSIGKQVASFPTGHGPINVMAQNPANAIILTGDSGGTVSMWSPNSKKPLVEMLTHRGSVLGIAADNRGHYMATTGLDRRMRIWDLRNYKELVAYASKGSDFGHLVFSQTNCIAVAAQRTVQVFKEAHLGHTNSPYLMHRCDGLVTDLQFCPHEDVLGVGHSLGFVSLLIPGSGDANFDALRSNPYESKKQRQEREVRMLLDKIQPELITLDPADINQVSRKGLRQTLDYKSNVLHIKPTTIEDAGNGEAS